MSYLKKGLGLFLAASMAAGALTGCGGGSGSAGSDGNAGGADTGAAQTVKGQRRLPVMCLLIPSQRYVGRMPGLRTI